MLYKTQEIQPKIRAHSELVISKASFRVKIRFDIFTKHDTHLNLAQHRHATS